MKGFPRLDRSVTRRTVLKGAAAGAGAAVLAANRRAAVRAQDNTVVYMSNQRHDRVVKEELFRQFEEQSGIRVEMQVFADEYPDQLKLAFESGNPPDIFNLTSPRQQVQAGWAEPMDDYLAKTPGLRESFLPGAFVPNRGIYDGKTYGLPTYAQTMRLFYNRSIFQRAELDPNAPPTTFSELRQMSKQITDALVGEGVYGFILGDKFTWVWWMNATVPANGAGAYPFDRKTGRYTFTHDGFKQALNLMIGMQEDGSIFPGIHTLTDDDARQQFSLGRAGMIIGGAWNPGVFNDQFESTEDWETAYLPVPDSGLAGRHQQNMGDRYTISAPSEKKDQAWEVMEFLYSVETMTTMYERGMGVMAVEAANTGESSVRGIPKLAPTENDLILPPEPELPTITPDYQTVFQSIFDDPSTMDQQLVDVERVYNETLDKAVADGLIKLEEFIVPDFDPLTWQPPQ
jgi:multiple sugar transport system substrate-binding protein